MHEEITKKQQPSCSGLKELMLFLFILLNLELLPHPRQTRPILWGFLMKYHQCKLGFCCYNVIFLKQDLSPIFTFNFCCCQFNRFSSLIILGFAYMSSASLFPEAECDKEGYRLALVLEVTILATVHAKGSCYMNFLGS